ncbi:MAG: CotH kinase family protein [Oscillospiraceae bacterium]|jgi:spore coat protein CotH|nr:CotH kinase family protein [Oscillospiraceae bacterium]
MIESKRISLIVAVVMSFALLFCGLATVLSGSGEEDGTLSAQPDYVTKIFGEDIITIDIIADESAWQSMLDNAASEEFIMADVVINGEKVQNIGIRPKGNSSLTQVAQSGSDRYSFRLQFDEYIKNQNCFGLESMVVNNMMGDYTYMKEYVSYELMREAGVDVPCFGFASITVNGEAWGLYLAVELYNDSYEQRVVGDTSGMLYNVKSMDMGGNMGGERTDNIADSQSAQAPDSTGVESSGSRAGRGGMENIGGRGGNGGTLQYTDDASSSYSAIFNNVVGKGAEDDYQRVIAALKALSEGRNLEQYFDVDRILRYLAAHTVVVNLDSYSSSMAQNYYLYEKDGKVTVLPWDYNLAWGGFQSGTASSVVNFPIDTPISGVEMSARPLLEKLFANEEYLSRYHSYLQQLLDSYFVNGQFESNIRAIDAVISEFVKNDPTAFCTYEQYQSAVEAFVTLGNLRAQSIAGQLDGTVPATTAEQSANPDLLIAADSVSLSTLGSMGGGGGQMGGDRTPGGQNEQGGNRDGTQQTLPEGEMPQGEQPQGNFPGGMGENMPDRELMQQAMRILEDAGGTITDAVKEQLLALGLTEEQISMLANMRGGMDGGPGGQGGFGMGGNAGGQSGSSQSGAAPEDESGGTQAAGGNISPVLGNTAANTSVLNTVVLAAVLLLLLIAATVLVARHRNRY